MELYGLGPSFHALTPRFGSWKPTTCRCAGGMRATRCPPPPSSAFPAIACSNWARRSKSRRRQAPDRILNMRCDIRSPAAHDENHAGAAVAKKFVHAAEAKPLCGVHGLTRRCGMPEKEVIERARKDKREGKSASTQAGEFVREEIDHIR